MERKDSQQVENLFHAALEMKAVDRAAYLAEACSGDMSLWGEVESLIAAFENRNDLMEQSTFRMGMEVLGRNSEESMAGKSLGAYKIMTPLGKGGMGEVYLAEDTRLGRKVALKFLSGEFVGDNWAKRQLIKEAQAVAMLDHPNICHVYGIEEEQGHSFIVMQYVEGETLADLIRFHRPPPAEVLRLANQIVGALAESHAHGIIHRDIKPRNIMVSPSGQVKVLDFGLAKSIQQKQSLESTDSISHLSQTGLVPGTVAYMSPEQLRAEKLDYRSDIFSFGTVLYEIVSGKNPYARGNNAELISAILTSEPPPLKNVAPDVSSELERIVHKCLEKDRDKRYQSASELLFELGDNGVDVRPHLHWRPQPSSRAFAALALVVLLVAVSVFAYIRLTRGQSLAIFTSSSKPSPNAGQPPAAAVYSLAVLPVFNESRDKSDEYLSDGLTESLINKFSSLAELRVSPYTSVSGYKGKTVDPRAVGQELNADAVLLGNIVKRRNGLVLQSKLIRTADGSQIWGGEHEIKWPTIINLEDQLAKSVTDSLELRLEDEKKFLASHGTNSPEAFRQYMLGRYYWRNRDKENINRAIGYFKEAIRLDPIYARAYAGLADSYVLLSTVSFGKTPTEEAMTLASAAAKEALAIDDNLAEAHTSLGVVSLRYEWNWQNAETEFKRAIELNPDYAPAHYWYSHLLLIMRRNDEAIAESTKAKNLDPSSPPSVMNFCRTLSVSGQYDNAIACYDKLLKENPRNEHAQYLLGLVYERIGRNEEALRMFERLFAKNKALAGAALGYAYGKAGRKDAARKVLAEMEHLAKQRYVPSQEFAIIYIGLGDNDNAFAWLEKAYEEHFATLIYLTVEPLFTNLRSDPRYDALVKRLNLPPPLP